MTIGTEVESDEFPGATGVVVDIEVAVVQVLWLTETGSEFLWWSHQDALTLLQ